MRIVCNSINLITIFMKYKRQTLICKVITKLDLESVQHNFKIGSLRKESIHLLSEEKVR